MWALGRHGKYCELDKQGPSTVLSPLPFLSNQRGPMAQSQPRSRKQKSLGEDFWERENRLGLHDFFSALSSPFPLLRLDNFFISLNFFPSLINFNILFSLPGIYHLFPSSFGQVHEEHDQTFAQLLQLLLVLHRKEIFEKTEYQCCKRFKNKVS